MPKSLLSKMSKGRLPSSFFSSLFALFALASVTSILVSCTNPLGSNSFAQLNFLAKMFGLTYDYQNIQSDWYATTPQASAIDSQGNLYVAATGNLLSVNHWIVVKWNGSSWSLLDDFVYSGGSTTPSSIAVDTNGNITVAGSGSSHWLVRQWNGTSWSTVDDFHPGTIASANSTAVDSSGNAYVAGYANESAQSHWIVRQWNGSVWTTVDDFQGGGYTSNQAYGVTVDSSGNVWSVGTAYDSGGIWHWIVRKCVSAGSCSITDQALTWAATGLSIAADSSNNIYTTGYNWVYPSAVSELIVRKNGSTIYSYQYSAGVNAQGKNIILDSTGKPTVLGYATEGSVNHWIVKQYNGSSWQALDDYPSATGVALSAGTSGTLYATGSSIDSSGLHHWMTRMWNGTSWSTLPEYIYAGYQPTPSAISPMAVTSDSLGNTFAVGSQTDGTGIQHWIVLKNGSVMDDYSYTSGYLSIATGVAWDSAGILYVSGYGMDSTYSPHWIVRRWDGANWSVDDNYQYISGFAAQAQQLFIDSSHNVYVAGSANDSSYYSHWIIRKRAASIWSTIDDYQGPNNRASAVAVSADAAGNVYSVGTYYDTTYINHWILRKNGSVIEDYDLDPSYDADHANSSPVAVGVDLTGNVFVAGYATDSAHLTHWLLRECNSSGCSTVDNYNLASTFQAQAVGMVIDSKGAVYTAGNATDSSSLNHWIVRKYAGSVASTVEDLTYPSSTTVNAIAIALSPFGMPICMGTSGMHWLIFE
jgi:hypothetical protein